MHHLYLTAVLFLFFVVLLPLKDTSSENAKVVEMVEEKTMTATEAIEPKERLEKGDLRTDLTTE